MTSPSQYDQLAARLMRQRKAQETAEKMPSGGVSLARVERALAKRRARAFVERWSRRALLAAAVLLAVVGAGYAVRRLGSTPQTAVMTMNEGPVTITRNGQSVVVSAGESIRNGDRLAPKLGQYAQVTLLDGTTLDVNGRLSVVSLQRSRRFQLEQGTVKMKVQPQRNGDSLTVTAGDVDVEVWGTQFDVTRVPPEEGCGGTVRVDVSEGVVAIRQNGIEASRLHAGDRWPTCKEDDTEIPPTNDGAVESPDFVPPPSRETGALGEQNIRYRSAIALKKQGDASAAIAALDSFLRRYPHSPLAESAYVERMRLLFRIDVARGREAAAQYLKRYPSGFAAAEASELSRP